MVKKADVVIVSAVLLSVCFFFFGNLFKKDENNGKYVSVYVDGKKEYSYTLYDKNSENIKIDNKYGHNEVVIEDGGVYVKESDCRGKDCIKTGKISELDDFIICAPHKLFIKIETDAGDDGVSAVSY